MTGPTPWSIAFVGDECIPGSCQDLLHNLKDKHDGSSYHNITIFWYVKYIRKLRLTHFRTQLPEGYKSERKT
jgi:hypothetical protein